MGGDYGVEWGSLRTRDGVGMDPAPIGVMLSAPDSRTANEAYWGIEGTAFYSRQLEEAALPVTRVLVDAVCKGECTYWGTVYATDALVELTCPASTRCSSRQPTTRSCPTSSPSCTTPRTTPPPDKPSWKSSHTRTFPDRATTHCTGTW